ncbi:MAG: FTR1 family protein [Mariprofundaceae bacterium]
MTSSLIIVFREVLEMTLVISIMLAATAGLEGARRWIGAGVLAGLAGAIVVALLAGWIGKAASGAGEELFNAGVLIAASIMIAWTVIWMSQHSRELVKKIKQVGHSVAEGDTPYMALAIVVAIAVLREGSEVVLFLYGTAAAQGDTSSLLTGGLIGLCMGVLTGAAIYFGLLRIPTGRIFLVTGCLLAVLAAGMASHASAYLVAANIIPALGQPLWDSSSLIPEAGWLGQFLHVMMGYDDRPSGVQVVVFLAFLSVIAVMMRHFSGASTNIRKQVPA